MEVQKYFIGLIGGVSGIVYFDDPFGCLLNLLFTRFETEIFWIWNRLEVCLKSISIIVIVPFSTWRRQQEAELKLIEEETARRVVEAIRKRVQEGLNSEEIKLEIDKRLEEGRKKLVAEVAAQLEKEKEAALIEASRKEASICFLAGCCLLIIESSQQSKCKLMHILSYSPPV
ncbi:UNVERIFIED_CONTAM: hypothetical protein Sradi_1475400 [Sesamum radiatum]|uniref:Uncharacterized protein n=1 Tax=Sesamum radiatum TaxID=300843 RepID=A0AAW2U750_SESRA